MCGGDQNTLQIPVKRCLDFDGKREDSSCVTKVCVLTCIIINTYLLADDVGGDCAVVVCVYPLPAT